MPESKHPCVVWPCNLPWGVLTGMFLYPCHSEEALTALAVTRPKNLCICGAGAPRARRLPGWRRHAEPLQRWSIWRALPQSIASSNPWRAHIGENA